MEQGDWQNDPEYPNAPLPAHERSWRHPSEIGATQWATTEPPLVVGRGLSVATGTIGAALAVGLLWLMIPHHSRSGVSAGGSVTSLRETLVNSSNDFVSSAVITPTVDTASVDSTNDTGVALPSATTVAESPTTSLPETAVSNVAPMPTLLINSANAQPGGPATAVALTPGHFVITTARAVGGRQGLSVVLPSGATVIGAVVLVDKSSGIAVLSIPFEIDASVVEVSPDNSQLSGTKMLMMSPEPLEVSIVADDSGMKLVYDGDLKPGEGSVVLDQRGRLLGMCTMSTQRASLVSVDAMLRALDAAATIAVPAWLGIRPTAIGAGIVAVDSVVVDGPASAGGVRAGDVIRDVDGMPLASVEELGQVIASHAAGDSVALKLVRAGETAPIVVTITLSSHPDSM